MKCQAEQHLADRIEAARRICEQVERNPEGWGGDLAVSLARTIRRELDGQTGDGWSLPGWGDGFETIATTGYDVVLPDGSVAGTYPSRESAEVTASRLPTGTTVRDA